MPAGNCWQHNQSAPMELAGALLSASSALHRLRCTMAGSLAAAGAQCAAQVLRPSRPGPLSPLPAARRRLWPRQRAPAAPCRAEAAAAGVEVRPEGAIASMPAWLDSLKWDSSGLVVAIAQHVDTGEVLMQAFADRAAVCETLQTG